MTLYHYTCEHGFDGINRDGFIHTGEDGIVWMTDMQWPIARPLGLHPTQLLIPCNRTEYRFEVTDESGVWPWIDLRKKLPDEIVYPIELVEKISVRHWWAAVKPVKAVYSPLRPT